MKAYLARKFEFESAHFYKGCGGRLENLHGHNYTVWVILGGEINEYGMITSVEEIKRKVKPVVEYFDHRLLNNLPEFSVINPTVEIISKVIYHKLKVVFDNLFAVKVYESDRVFGAYDGKSLLGSLKYVNLECGDWKYEVWVKGEINPRGMVANLDTLFEHRNKLFERFERLIDGFGHIRIKNIRLFFKTFTFSSSHVLGLKGLTPSENLKIFGKCSREEGHGHNYRITLYFKDDGRFNEVKGLIEKLDHTHLNDFMENPTLENIGLFIFQKSSPEILKIYETPRTYVIVTKDYLDIISAI